MTKLTYKLDTSLELVFIIYKCFLYAWWFVETRLTCYTLLVISWEGKETAYEYFKRQGVGLY